MYNQGNMYGGMMQMPKIPHATQAVIEASISQMLGGRVSGQFSRLKENDSSAWRHSCVRTGLCVLAPTVIQVYDSQVTFVVCPQCGKVVYYAEKFLG